ncbi:hypothetical protein GCM10010409_27120 [Mycolicibacterium diernhoferi]
MSHIEQDDILARRQCCTQIDGADQMRLARRVAHCVFSSGGPRIWHKYGRNVFVRSGAAPKNRCDAKAAGPAARSAKHALTCGCS